MKGCIVLIGEAFRKGGQYSRLRGLPESFEDQINACKSHIKLINLIETIHFISKIDVVIESYTTSYDKILSSLYKDNLIHSTFHPDAIGLNNLIKDSINHIKLSEYNFIFFMRIDLCFKNRFYEVFDPNWDTIKFPTVCFKERSVYKNFPRINDTMLFLPRKYFDRIQYINLCHESWYNLRMSGQFKVEDLNVMIDTYHDSDSAKDYNPLYRIVNRPESKVWHSEGYKFKKI
jgi:hypothetical protein